MSKPKQNLHITALHDFYFPVKNAGVSSTWYQNHFGLQQVSASDRSETLRLKEGALLTLVEIGLVNHYDSVPIHFKAHDANKAYQLLDKTEVSAEEPEKFHHYTDFKVKDPDGNIFGVISDPAWPNTPNNYFKIDGVFIGVGNTDQAYEWYSDVFGADIEYDFTHPTETLADARCICFRGIPVSLVESPVLEVHYRICDFRTSNIIADYAYLQSKGVRMSELSKLNDNSEFCFYDLDGREFGMVGK